MPPRPSRAACAAPSRAPRGASRNSITEAAGNFGARRREAAVLAVVAAAQLGDRRVERRRVELARVGRRGSPAPCSRGRMRCAGRLDLRRAARARRSPTPTSDLRPGRHALPRLGREVGAGEERHAVGGEEGVQRPAAVPGHGLHGVHVDRVDVRALLAVDLDAHEALVHQRGDLRVLEGLALHHVAPVAGGVADRDEDRLLLVARAAERLLAPRVPVDGVLRVLEQVGRGLVARGGCVIASGCLSMSHHRETVTAARRAGGRRSLLPRRQERRADLPLRPDPARPGHGRARRGRRRRRRRAAASTTSRSSRRRRARRSPTPCAAASTSPTCRPSSTSTRPTATYFGDEPPARTTIGVAVAAARRGRRDRRHPRRP